MHKAAPFLFQDGRPALTFLGALRIGVPVAAAQCVGLIAGNTAAGLQGVPSNQFQPVSTSFNRITLREKLRILPLGRDVYLGELLPDDQSLDSSASWFL